MSDIENGNKQKLKLEGWQILKNIGRTAVGTITRIAKNVWRGKNSITSNTLSFIVNKAFAGCTA